MPLLPDRVAPTQDKGLPGADGQPEAPGETRNPEESAPNGKLSFVHPRPLTDDP